MEEETIPLLIQNPPEEISVKKKIFAAFCALAASIIFAGNNLLIQEKNLHCSDLLLFRSILQVVIFGFLIKLRNVSFFPTNFYPTRRESIIEVVYLFAQVI